MPRESHIQLVIGWILGILLRAKASSLFYRKCMYLVSLWQ